MSKVKELEKNKVQIEVQVGKDAFLEAINKAYLKNKGRFNIPGFRKGKAPRHMIENYYGENVFFEDAFDIAFPEAYRTAVEETGIDPVSRPDIDGDVFEMDKENGVKCTVSVYVRPEVKLGQYEGVEIEKKKYPVTKKEIDKELERVRERNARFVDVDREAKNGDKTVIDYAGSVDGVAFEGGTAEGQTLDLGSGMFIPGFEDQVVGMKAGETKDINVTFPEEYHAKDLAGKDAVFKVTLQSVKEKELPELNDEFAQEVSEFDTLEDYKKDIRKNLKEQAENRKKREKEEAVIAKIVENAEIDIPDCMIQNQIDYQLQEMEYNMSYQGITLQNYLDYTGMTMEQLREQYKEVAEQRVRTQLVLDAIREKMALEATEEEVDEELNNMAERAKKPADEFKKGINPREIEYIKERIVFDKLIDHLVNSAVEVEKAKEAKETKKEKKEEDK